jgi:hypothetical protein
VAGLVTRPEESIDIDTPMDLALAELLYAQRTAERQISSASDAGSRST